MTARALLAAPGALRALRRGGRGAVELVLRRGAYVRFGDDWLLLAAPGAGAGPLSLVVASLEWEAVRPGLPAAIAPGRLLLGRQTVSLERLRERRPAMGAAQRPARDGDRRAAAAAALAVTSAPPACLAGGLRALRAGRLVEAVPLLAGCGDGLTPAGDDALAGYAAWRRASGRPVAVSRLARGRSSPLGLAYLRCAELGELPGAGIDLLTALAAGSPRKATSAAIGVHEWGSSSGAALVWGLSAGAAAETQASPSRTLSSGSAVRGGFTKRTGPPVRPERMSW